MKTDAMQQDGKNAKDGKGGGVLGKPVRLLGGGASDF
jgi:hypothetical protein